MLRCTCAWRAPSVTSSNEVREQIRRSWSAGRFRERAGALFQRLRGAATPARLALSIGLGLFIGCLPLYGLHLTLCVLICVPLRLDAVAAYLAANISNPLVAPLLLLAEVQLGSLLLTGQLTNFDLASARRIGASGVALQLGLGSVVLGAGLGCLGAFIAWWVARRGKPRTELEGAQRRTRARYVAAPRSERCYVRAKLALDPVLRQLAELGPLGEVIDAGCGRGQLGLCLLELGRVERLRGFDFDARKVQIGKLAARGEADFFRGDLTLQVFEAADTVLLIDVLHYLSFEQQDALLERAAACLRLGGRLIVREVELRSDARSWLTRRLERWAIASGYNQSRERAAFRPLAVIESRLQALGLDCMLAGEGGGLGLSNRLLVARRHQ